MKASDTIAEDTRREHGDRRPVALSHHRDMPAPAPVVTLATAADIEAARAILIGAAVWLADRGIQQWQADEFTAPLVATWLGDLYIARDTEGAPWGVFRLTPEDPDIWPEITPHTTDTVLHRLARSRDRVGSGAGQRLLDAACATAAGLGCTTLRLDCWAGNTRLRTFYAAAGFTYVDDIDVGAYIASRFVRDLAAAPSGAVTE